MPDEPKKLQLAAGELERLMKDRFERPMPRRFYEQVRVAGDAPPFTIELDGKPLKTPLKAPFEVPTRPLAEAVADEWRAQEKTINPFAMPLTRLCNAAIDRVRGRRSEVLAAITAHGAHELLCYRAETPLAFAHLQAETWDPLLQWAERQMGAGFTVTRGVMPVAQDERTLRAIAGRYGVFGDYQLAALNNMATLTSSAILPLAVAERHLSPEQAWRAANLEEQWNISQWGEDAEAAARLKRRGDEFLSAARLMELLDTGLNQ